MASRILDMPYFHCEEAAFAHLESVLWPNGPICPQVACKGKLQRLGRLKKTRTKVGQQTVERVERLGLHHCYNCGRTFTVRKGTVFEKSHLPLHRWLQAIYIVTSAKRSTSTRQIQSMLGGSLKTAWSLLNQLRPILESSEMSGMVEARLAKYHASGSKPSIQSQRFVDYAKQVRANGSAEMLELIIAKVAKLPRNRSFDAGREIRCSRCDTAFTCDPGGRCWCMDLPPVMPMTGGACFCPRCLGEKITERSAVGRRQGHDG